MVDPCFHPLSHTDAENSFCLAGTALNSALNPGRVVVFGRMLANAVPTLKTIYAFPKIRAKFETH